ncbi:hypothetical protein CONLIGDRAFT_260945 [Coniochaeta ligniaria NRRL 30616]|uniref:GPI anchored protein n=1 Tax=Coniochaeta ligniaria NRRL 30616 TaxID=1408157 RepID=A0A1J7JWQ6_9PEZI|nr:hypothetical protein CONLIGDRAFT_260945 [Coniochaeta ligniaria NRRL 30616]
MGNFNLAAIATALSILTAPSLAQATSQAESSSIVTLHLPNFDDQTILASVITANPTATSYLLTCPTDEPDDECGLGSGIRVLEGPSTLEVHMTLGQITDDVTCSLSGDAADCDQSAKGEDGMLTTGAMHYEGISSWAMPVTVTAGLEALTSTSGSSTTISTSTTNAVSSTGSSGSASTPTGAAQSSKTSTAGMVAVTGNAVVAGVAAVLGGMLVV